MLPRSIYFQYFHSSSVILIYLHCFSIPKPSRNLQNNLKAFEIGAKSCKRMIRTYKFHQNRHLVHYGCQKSWFHFDFCWNLLIFIDFSLNVIDFPFQNHQKTYKNHWKTFKIGAKSCKRIIKTHNFHQTKQLVHYECKNTLF